MNESDKPISCQPSVTVPSVDIVQAPSAAQARRTLISFIGRVEDIAGDTAYVTLFDKSTGEQIEAECNTDRLKGVQNGGEFMCEVAKKDGKVSIDISPLPPKVLSKAKLAEIRRSLSRVWTF